MSGEQGLPRQRYIGVVRGLINTNGVLRRSGRRRAQGDPRDQGGRVLQGARLLKDSPGLVLHAQGWEETLYCCQADLWELCSGGLSQSH